MTACINYNRITKKEDVFGERREKGQKRNENETAWKRKKEQDGKGKNK